MLTIELVRAFITQTLSTQLRGESREVCRAGIKTCSESEIQISPMRVDILDNRESRGLLPPTFGIRNAIPREDYLYGPANDKFCDKCTRRNFMVKIAIEFRN